MKTVRLLSTTAALMLCANLWGCSGQQPDKQSQPSRDGAGQRRSGEPELQPDKKGQPGQGGPAKGKQAEPELQIPAEILAKGPESTAAWLVDKFNGVIDKIEVDQVRGDL